MFTIEQIKAAHAKVKSGADFPNYVQEIFALGVTRYETYVADGHILFYGREGYTIKSGAKYEIQKVADQNDRLQFQHGLKEHQEGKSDYATFCSMSARSGVEKWVVDMARMTCTYYDKAGNEMLVENIPVPARLYRK